MKNEIRKVYEMMHKLNPDFVLNEDTFDSSLGDPSTNAPTSVPTGNTQQTQQSAQTQQTQQPQTQQTQQPQMSGDSGLYNTALQKATSLNNAGSNINTTTEFPQAFQSWFSKLGYSPQNSNISISNVLSSITKVMQSMGYK